MTAETFREYNRVRQARWVNKNREHVRALGRERYRLRAEHFKNKSAAWRKKNAHISKRTYRKWQLKSRFGISIEQYEEMLDRQERKCAICGMEQKGEKSLAVDHNHLTGKVRELLCAGCNFIVGVTEKNDKLWMSKVVEYLEKHAE